MLNYEGEKKVGKIGCHTHFKKTGMLLHYEWREVGKIGCYTDIYKKEGYLTEAGVAVHIWFSYCGNKWGTPFRHKGG